jgi:cellulose synthase/poly-beta-1,6-N-acetylglucosamine synthase-like glycosyltransferase
MIYIEITFWLLIFFIFYSYIGYPILLFIITKFNLNKKINRQNNYQPTVTLFVTAFNEEDYVDMKVENSFNMDYPKDKLQFIWVTDGSIDNTNTLLKKYENVKVYYTPERNGKINAMNRGMQFIDTDIVIFSDANTLLSKDTVKEMVKLFEDEKTGCIAGEKRIELSDKDTAAAAGEGFYWKYESWIKQMDAQVGSCVGAAGELFAIRKSLFFNVPDDTILDDFIISLTIAMQGYKIDYTPKAYAVEKASANIAEEMKRKIRIAAGSIQAVVRLKPLLNIFNSGFLSFQYISHKIMRWIITPLALLLIIPLNIYLAYSNTFYFFVLLVQAVFYLFVITGWILKDKQIKAGIIFVPYYFFLANLAMWIGFFRYVKGTQSVKWERAKRQKI